MAQAVRRGVVNPARRRLELPQVLSEEARRNAVVDVAPAGCRDDVHHLSWSVLPAARVPSVTAGAEEHRWLRNDWEQQKTTSVRRNQNYQ